MHVRIKYFFAGGRAREPCVKEDEYLSEADWRLSWIVDMLRLYSDIRLCKTHPTH